MQVVYCLFRLNKNKNVLSLSRAFAYLSITKHGETRFYEIRYMPSSAIFCLLFNCL